LTQVPKGDNVKTEEIKEGGIGLAWRRRGEKAGGDLPEPGKD